MKPKEAELCVKSSEPGGVPWVRLKAIILRITKAIGSSSKDFIDNEGALPFGFELTLFSSPGGIEQVLRRCMF